jgi:hypothetical protein
MLRVSEKALKYVPHTLHSAHKTTLFLRVLKILDKMIIAL